MAAVCMSHVTGARPSICPKKRIWVWAIEIPVEIPLIATGVLGHCMHVDITTLASMAEAALALQRDCASFNDIDD